MEQKNRFSALIAWLRSTEMFARPSKQIPGKWKLVEYYTEPEGSLQNIKEEQLKARNEFWNIEFSEKNEFSCQHSLPLQQLTNLKGGNWRISKNYILLNSTGESSFETEFQFAIEKNQMKFLKKDNGGRIEFFGFFNRM